MKNWLGCLFLLLIAMSPLAFAEDQPQNQNLPPLPLTHKVSFDSLRIMVREGYVDQAIPLAVEYLKHEENSDVRTLLGRMYYLKDEYPEAKEQYEIVLRNKPNGYTDASIGLANVYMAMNDYQSALNVVNDALNKSSTSQELINKKNQILSRLSPGTAPAPSPTHEEETSKTQAISYENLRKMAYSGKAKEAIPLAEAYLKQQENSDVRILLARMYIWDKRYDEAREQLVTVLQQHPNGYSDASEALADVELDQNQPQRALDVVNAGLVHAPDSETLLTKKKRVLARIAPNGGIARGPAQEFLETGMVMTETESGQNQEYQPQNLIWIDKEYSYVSDLKETWELTTMSYTRYTPYGSIIGRYNYAYRFGTYGAQYEIDAYPHLFSGAYLYMSYGYSQDTSIFPRNRTGLEAFFSLPESFEFSFGMRTLHFSTTTVLYTGSIAKYIGNYWIAYRPYIVDGVTNYFTFRRYFSTADSYMSLTLGTGYGENFYSLALPNTISPNKSSSIRLDGQLPVLDNLLFTWVVENSLNGFPNGLNRTETDLELGFIWRY